MPNREASDHVLKLHLDIALPLVMSVDCSKNANDHSGEISP